MTLTLEAIKTNTQNIFEKEETLTVPKPATLWLDKLNALEEAKLDNHRKACLFDMRCWQADQMGFQKLKVEEFVPMLMGEPHTGESERTDLARQTHEWFYNHHTDVTLTGDKCNWGGHPHDYLRIEKPTPWYLAPFCKNEKWRCRFGKLDYLKREIPYGVLLRINELKALKLFNVFNVIAPLEAWERKTDIDPIVLATIWEIIDNKACQTAHYFLAQW